MKNNRRIIADFIFIFFGIVLFGLGFTDFADPFWSGMGGALIAIGVVRIIHFFRFRNNEAYREKIELERTDERNRFIRNKAWAWAGYLFVLAASVSTIAFKLLHQDLLSIAAGFAVCLIVLLYWICYFILNRKY